MPAPVAASVARPLIVRATGVGADVALAPGVVWAVALGVRLGLATGNVAHPGVRPGARVG